MDGTRVAVRLDDFDFLDMKSGEIISKPAAAGSDGIVGPESVGYALGVADLLDCTVMPYAWGSRTAIASLQGRPTPAPTPEAELWMGAHPLAPSRLTRSGTTTDLAAVIAADSDGQLGRSVAGRFGPRLPFLLKVLAPERPLSLQAHPTAAQAAAGFEDEERRGVPRSAAHRNYKDPHHKPELICALTPFEALCGFRRAADTRALFDALAVPQLDALASPLRSMPGAPGVEATFRALMTLGAGDAARLVEGLVRACRSHRGAFRDECRWAVRLAEEYPGDRGVASALMLNLVRLEPGEAIYLDAGNLHAYLHGVGVEIMASSDNVLRGGLTPKHVDVPELLKVLDFLDGPVPVRRSREVDRHEVAWDTPAAEFRLSRIHVAAEAVGRLVTGPEILCCVDGAVRLTPGDGTATIGLSQGASAFVPANTGRYRLDGAGTLFRATTNT
jgi:mannose-6-phosphate isomerase